VAEDVWIRTANGIKFRPDAILYDPVNKLYRMAEGKFGYVDNLDPLTGPQMAGYLDFALNGGTPYGKNAKGLAGQFLPPQMNYFGRTYDSF
jgi:hypothetical protein